MGLLLVPQLQRLYINYCRMKPDAIAALPLLARMEQLRSLEWYEPGLAPIAEIDDTLDSLAEVTQLKQLRVGCNSIPASSRVAVVQQMPQLELLEVGLFTCENGEVELPVIRWDILDAPRFSQLLSSCSLLTSINMQGVVLNQAGLDALLAHPHVVDITLMSIAATESRVNSHCSWKVLTLPPQKDVRTVAYVPLHSLTEPLEVCKLLLPPDVPPEQLPQLLQAAAARMADHRHLFRFNTGGAGISVTDYLSEIEDMDFLQWGEPQQDSFAPEECLALVTALSPLVRIPHIVGLSFDLNVHEEQRSARLRFGKAELEALSGAWGNQLRFFSLAGVGLADDFFPAIETALPKLETLGFNRLTNAQDMRLRYMLMCQRFTRPLTLYLDHDEEQ
jgi:hypothetical protein